jgi:hypothetical protein
MEDIFIDAIRKALIPLFQDQQEALMRLLVDKKCEPHSEDPIWFDLTQLCEYLPDKPKKSTVYGQVHDGLIPTYKGSKKLRFLKSDIDKWLQLGRKKTFAEIDDEANSYIKTKGGRQ